MDPKYFVANQEKTTGPTTEMLSRAAKENAMYIFGGNVVACMESFTHVLNAENSLLKNDNIPNSN